MRKFVKINEIKSVSKTIKEKLDVLNKQIEILLNDINSINSYYKGKDSDIIISKYIKTIKNLKVVVTNYENYLKYFDLISGVYEENVETATRNLNQIFENFDNNYNNISLLENKKVNYE